MEPPNSGPGRGIRLFVAAFLAVFLTAGLVGVEAWPLTGWRLYARLRHGEFWGWEVLALTPGGGERPVQLGQLPPAYHGVNQLLNAFERRSTADRQTTCLGLVAAARRQYPDTAGVAVDHVLGHVRTGPHDRPRPPARRIRVHQCTEG